MLLTYENFVWIKQQDTRTYDDGSPCAPGIGGQNFLAVEVEPSSGVFVSPLCASSSTGQKAVGYVIPRLTLRVSGFDDRRKAEPEGFAMIQGADGLVADTRGRSDNGIDKSVRRKKAGSPDSHVANALKAAYDDAVGENVPDEFLDLLGKLS